MKKRNPTERREFLKGIVAAGGVGSLPQFSLPESGKGQGRRATAAAADTIGWPRVFSKEQLRMIAFPLGGVAAGSISLGGRGQLRDWEIFNRPDKGRSPRYAFAAIRVQRGKQAAVSRILESRIQPPYEGASGLGSANVPGLPRFEAARFTGEFPLAGIEFEEMAFPVKVSLEAFTPFIPHDADESGLPVTILRYRVKNPASATANVSIAFSVENPVGSQSHQNDYKAGHGLQGIFMRNPMMSNSDPQWGTFALSVLDVEGGKVTHLRGWRGGTGWPVGPLLFWDDFTGDGQLGPESEPRNNVGSICLQQTIPPRRSVDFTFLLSWHFPNRTARHMGWSSFKDGEDVRLGNFYAGRFEDAWQVAEHTAANLTSLETGTRDFLQAIRQTTLPGAIKEAAMANLSTLVTQTCFRTADGAFHGFEGSNDKSGCCFGSCTHVWNYETATQFLFPTLARSLREKALGFGTDEQGLMEFRHKLPYGQERWGRAAADGQMGQIIKTYLDWRLSGDDEWLRRHWPAAKRALEFSWIEGGWDADRDGVMEGVQHNTYDIEFYGPNPLCGVYYLGALRACEEMARTVGDSASAAVYRRLFEQGSKWIDANLFNGEYYIQKIQGVPQDKIAKGLIVGMGAANTLQPDFQQGDGCLVDQLLGQYLANLAGLGPLLRPENIRRTLQSIYRYNYKRELYRHESVQRVYALNDEAALVICDYGQGKRPEVPFPYYAEVMTGFEYSAAILMLQEGMIDEGIELIANIRRRYDGERRNPWNEAECGHHYARAMASWSAIPTLSGFQYEPAGKEIIARPKWPRDDFSSFWSTGTGWGTFRRRLRKTEPTFSLSVRHGTLAGRTLRLDGKLIGKGMVSLNGKFVKAEFSREEQGILVRLGTDLLLKAGDRLDVSL